MKKCPDCQREVDKVSFMCEYCGRLVKEKEKDKSPAKTTPEKKRGDPKN